MYVEYISDGSFNPYIRENALSIALLEESSAMTGSIILSVLANAICVNIEKLGLQSKNIISYSSLIDTKKSLIQSTTAIHVFVPGIFWFANVLIAFD